MHEVTIHVLDTDAPFFLEFKPLAAAGNPVAAGGPITWTLSDPVLASTPNDAPATQVHIALHGPAGTQNITATDGVATVLIHLVIDSLSFVRYERMTRRRC